MSKQSGDESALDIAAGSGLPVCKHCGSIPKWVQAFKLDGECTERLLWLECTCGMRTVAREVSYNLAARRMELIAIFTGPNAAGVVTARASKNSQHEKAR